MVPSPAFSVLFPDIQCRDRQSCGREEVSPLEELILPIGC